MTAMEIKHYINSPVDKFSNQKCVQRIFKMKQAIFYISHLSSRFVAKSRYFIIIKQ